MIDASRRPPPVPSPPRYANRPVYVTDFIVRADSAYARLEAHVDANDAGERDIKGLARPVRVYELVGLRS